MIRVMDKAIRPSTIWSSKIGPLIPTALFSELWTLQRLFNILICDPFQSKAANLICGPSASNQLSDGTAHFPTLTSRSPVDGSEQWMLDMSIAFHQTHHFGVDCLILDEQALDASDYRTYSNIMGIVLFG